jgi:hypothetical protein
MTMSEALDIWDKDEKRVRKLLKSEADFGKRFYNERLLGAIASYRRGHRSHFLLGFDATNGGLQHFGASFHSLKAMKLGNLLGGEAGDAHQDMADSLGITRDEAKRVNNPILHGSTLAGIAEALRSHGRDATEEEILEHIKETYGREATNIIDIADWGQSIYTTHNPSLAWKMPDGFLAQSTAYYKSVEMKVYGLSCATKTGYTSTIVHRDMPFELTRDGKVIDYGRLPSGASRVKVRGLYANITHSIDSWVLRAIVRALRNQWVDVLVKHDNFFVHPNYMGLVRELYRTLIKKEYDMRLYESALRDIAAGHSESPEVPELTYGFAPKSLIDKAEMFLMP